MRYRYANCAIDSTVELPELPEAEGSHALPTSIWVDGPAPATATGPGDGHQDFPDPTGATALTTSWHGPTLRVSFPGLADFESSAEGRVTWQASPACSPETIRHLLLDQVVPRLRARRGALVLHGALVDVEGVGSLLFLGDSGRGKSTLSAAFEQAGHGVLTDDCVLVEAQSGLALAFPSYPGFRLWPDSVRQLFGATVAASPRMAHYSEKLRLGRAPAASAAPGRRVVAAFLLEPPGAADDIVIAPLAGSDACMALLRNAFQFHTGDMVAVRQLLARADQVAAAIPIRTLRYPRDFAVLPTLVRRVRDVAAAFTPAATPAVS
jgi:hypothetical protein